MTTKPSWNGPYLTVVKTVPKPGMQNTRARLPSRKATCEEVKCEWFLMGHAGEDANFSFVHPAGVECGDFTRCQPCTSPIRERGANGVRYRRLCGTCIPCKVGTANCPCADRTHRVNDEQFPVKYNFATNKESREVGKSEFIDRTGEGMHALNHIRTRGL